MTEFSTVPLRCEYFPLCSGCDRHGDVSSPPIWQELKNFFHKAAPTLNLQLIVKEITNWRTRSKLAVRGTSQNPQIGLFKHGSHQVIPIPNCPLHHPAINAAHLKVRKALIAHKIEPYREETGTGILRYLQFAVERRSRRVQLTLVANRTGRDPQLEIFVKQLYSEAGLHSAWINFQPEKTNKIFGDEWQLCQGEPYIWERLGTADCAFHPACFGQAHLSLYEEVLKKIREWTPPHQKILELYSGVGTIGLNLVPNAKEVTCVEINPYAAECFHLNCLKLPSSIQRNISLKTASSQDATSLIPNKDLIIVDPPRKGIDPEVLQALCDAQPNTQLIYLSCGPQSFQKDCEKLLAHGWKIENAEGYLFFPGTDHVETLCVLRK